MRRKAANLRLLLTSHTAMMTEKMRPAAATKKRKGSWTWKRSLRCRRMRVVAIEMPLPMVGRWLSSLTE
jgi:hypothetical protein